ncbi:MAG TPA: HDOD domain-containing protein [Acidobacteriota bacterium]|nr:HDOD domain-containing protein [Acidobacteriota bacterium]
MDVFVARQPIFDRLGKVAAYELLFRSGWENSFPSVDPDAASAHTLANSVVTLGLDTLAGSKDVFVNFTQQLLTSGAAALLPPERSVVEVLESVDPADPDVLRSCRDLKRQGYRLALDDFELRDDADDLVKLADIIKVDYCATSPRQRADIVNKLSDSGVVFLAEKVETSQDVEDAEALGVDYLQGFFYCRPDIVAGRGIPAFKVSYLQLLRELHRPEFNIDRVEKLIKSDLSLSYGLLKLINSAAFALVRRIDSIRQALILLGHDRIKKWASVVILSEMATDKPQELVVNSIVRAYFCEMLAEGTRLRSRKDDLFLMGMFSLIDAILDQPLAEALESLPLETEVKQALMGQDGELSQVMELVQRYERADWAGVSVCASRAGIEDGVMPELYSKAVQFVDALRA